MSRVFSLLDFMIPGRAVDAKVAWLCDHGFSGIEVNYRNCMDDPDRFRSLCDAHGVEITCVTGVWQADGVSSDERLRLRQRELHRHNVVLAGRLGAPRYLFVDHIPTGHGAHTPEVRRILKDTLKDDLRRLGDTGAVHGVTVVIEPLARRFSPVLATVEETADFCAEVNHPNVTLMVDSYHMAYNGEDLEKSVADVIDVIGHVHCSDFRPNTDDPRQERPLPGMGTVDFEAYLRPLQTGGYQGPVGFEGSLSGDPQNLLRPRDHIRSILDRNLL